jgi:hypothetical protein
LKRPTRLKGGIKGVNGTELVYCQINVWPVPPVADNEAMVDGKMPTEKTQVIYDLFLVWALLPQRTHRAKVRD